MRVAIVGSREGIDPLWVRRMVSKIAEKYPHATIVSGGARGVDTEAEKAAVFFGLPTNIFPADWNRFGKRAGFLRNKTIVENCDIVVAFTTGSKGTAHTIKLAYEAGKEVHIYGPNGNKLEQSF